MQSRYCKYLMTNICEKFVSGLGKLYMCTLQRQEQDEVRKETVIYWRQNKV